MAHSFLSVTNESTERIVSVLDSMLNLFLSFFVMAVEDSVLNERELKILEHYNMELEQDRWSIISLQEEDIYQDQELKIWYFVVLEKMKVLVNTHGEYINKEFMNQLPKYKYFSNEDLSVMWQLNLINDLMWMFEVEGYEPSGQYQWFELALDDPRRQP